MTRTWQQKVKSVPGRELQEYETLIARSLARILSSREIKMQTIRLLNVKFLTISLCRGEATVTEAISGLPAYIYWRSSPKTEVKLC